MTDVKTIQIEDKKYDVKSVTKNGISLINELQKLEALISQTEFELNVLRNYHEPLMQRLITEAKNFEEVVEPSEE